MNLGNAGPSAAVLILLWLVWLGVMIAALVAFFRGMNALSQIPARLERIERALAARGPGDGGAL